MIKINIFNEINEYDILRRIERYLGSILYDLCYEKVLEKLKLRRKKGGRVLYFLKMLISDRKEKGCGNSLD